jgi:hypothetical protein
MAVGLRRRHATWTTWGAQTEPGISAIATSWSFVRFAFIFFAQVLMPFPAYFSAQSTARLTLPRLLQRAGKSPPFLFHV